MDLYNLVVSAKLSKGGGGDEPTGTKDITANGVYDVKSFASANVNVPTPAFSVQSLNVTENGTYSVPTGVDGFNPVTVNVSGGGGGGDHDAEDGIIERTISGAYTNSRVTSIGSNAFQFCTSLTTASFPNVTSIGTSAFRSCTSLTTASFPNATFIGNSAFQFCSSLEEISFPNATSIGASAFQNCKNLEAINFPNVTSIGSNAFQFCTSLTTASFPNATFIGHAAFQSCSSLTTAYFLASSVASLASSTVFSGTSAALSIYVPASLVDSYKTAKYWSYISSRITAYEG